jgi:ABC-2 type transport system ATP-binding protein
VQASQAIQVERLTKRYGRATGCEGVSFTLAPGQVLGFIGHNGAGKSTVIKVLAGLQAATEGSALIFGHQAGTPAAGRLLGFVPELFGLPDWPTPVELLRFYARISEVPADQVKTAVERALRRVELPEGHWRKPVRALSKGQRQRLSIAAALVHDPKVLLLDEPTSALDPVGRMQVKELIRTLSKEGVAVLLSSHILNDVEQVADKLVVIRQGRVVIDGPAEALMKGAPAVRLRARPHSAALVEALGDLGQVEELDAEQYRVSLTDASGIEAIAPAVLGAGAALLELAPERHSLEELVAESFREVKAHE